MINNNYVQVTQQLFLKNLVKQKIKIWFIIDKTKDGQETMWKFDFFKDSTTPCEVSACVVKLIEQGGGKKTPHTWGWTKKKKKQRTC